jgi:hypothetical protein
MTKQKLIKIINELLALARRSHYYVEDNNWYSCPLAPEGCWNDAIPKKCNCGADKINKRLDEIRYIINKDSEYDDKVYKGKLLTAVPTEDVEELLEDLWDVNDNMVSLLAAVQEFDKSRIKLYEYLDSVRSNTEKGESR